MTRRDLDVVVVRCHQKVQSPASSHREDEDAAVTLNKLPLTVNSDEGWISCHRRFLIFWFNICTTLGKNPTGDWGRVNRGRGSYPTFLNGNITWHDMYNSLELLWVFTQNTLCKWCQYKSFYNYLLYKSFKWPVCRSGCLSFPSRPSSSLFSWYLS